MKKSTARKFPKEAAKYVEKEMHEYKRGRAYSGKNRRAKVKSKQQAVAIGLSKARKEGVKIPKK